jgi:hypothetical protein
MTHLNVSNDGQIILENNRIANNAFSGIQLLFCCEDHKIEMILQHLVTLIDAQLLDRIFLKDFKHKNIKQSQGASTGRRICAVVVVDHAHNIQELAFVKVANQTVASITCFVRL